MKKILSILTVLCLSLLLVGCKDDNMIQADLTIVYKDGTKDEYHDVKIEKGKNLNDLIEIATGKEVGLDDQGILLKVNDVTVDWFVDESWWRTLKDEVGTKDVGEKEIIEDKATYQVIYTIGFDYE